MGHATHDLHRKLPLALLGGMLLAMLVAGIAVLSYELTSFRPRTVAQLNTAARVMGEINRPVLASDDAAAARERLGLLKQYADVDAGAVYRRDGSVFAAWAVDGQEAIPSPAPSPGLREEGAHASLAVPVVHDGRTLGLVWVRQSLPPLLKRLPQYAIMFGALSLAMLPLGLLLLLSTQRVLARNRELQQAMQMLMQREKLAALGGVVAGVAHELNTPIGNALLAATNLQQETRRLRGLLGGASVSRQDLEDYLDSVAEGSLIAARSLERAATLVHSFKSVAVNETSEARMPFELRQVLQDGLALLAPGLRRKPVELSLDCPAGIGCESYPGALTQILSNLIENAIRHGLEPKGGGRIDLVASSQDGWVNLDVRDNGVGIAPEVIDHIFEPFFTTRLGQGGSGLGLHLVHQLATGPLGGSISARSEPGAGSCFTLRFPCSSPEPAAR